MCTVTFLPLSDSSFILTSNRDESALRPKASPPEEFQIANQQVIFPKDHLAGGTWISTAINGVTLCLLNGAYFPHKRKETYRLSRGIMLLDFYNYNDVHQFYKEYRFEGIEPFTLLVVDDRHKLSLHQLIWDGNTMDVQERNNMQPEIWSSVTLYDPDIIIQRKLWFSEWLEHNSVWDQNAIMHFHEFGGHGDEQSNLVMSRGKDLYTLSISSVLKSENESLMKYMDLTDREKYEVPLKLKDSN